MRIVMWIAGKREQVEKVVAMLTGLCKQLRSGEIQIKDMPLDNILEFIAKIYDEGKGAEFVSLYACTIADCVERNDVPQLVNIIELLLYHALLVQYFQEDIHFLEQKAIQLQCSNARYSNDKKIREWTVRHGCDKECNKVPFSGKGVVYCAVTGGYDRINEPQYVNSNLDYILFTDDPNIRSDVWQVRLIDNAEKLDNTRLARKIKLLGYRYLKDYEYSIWVDGKMAIVGDLEEFVQENRGCQPMLCFNHPVADCIYEEEKRCAEINKDDPALMEAQMERYRKEGYPRHNGLIESAILVRELKDSRVVHLMDVWWQEVLWASKRDQLSFNYVCWKNDFVYDSTDLYIYENKYVRFCGHR